MSFDNLEKDLTYGCSVIKAENFDNEGQESNGGGKSSFVDIVPVALLGQSLTGRNLKDCVNWSTEQNFFSVEVEMEHPIEGNCIILRKVYSNTKSAELYITKNGKTPKEIPTKGETVDINEGNKYILSEILDISKNDLLNYYFISGDYYTSYFKASAPKKVEIINRFSKADKIDRAIEEAQKSEKDKIAIIEDCERVRVIANDNIERAKEAIKELENIKSVDIGKYDALKEGVNELREMLYSMDTSKIDELEKERSKVREKSHVFNSERMETLKILKAVEVKLSGTIECPKCNYKFTLAGDDISNLEKMRDELKELEEMIRTQEIASDADIQKVVVKLEEAKTALNNSKKEIEDQIIKYEEEIKNKKEKVDEHKKLLNLKEAHKQTIERDLENIKLQDKREKECSYVYEKAKIWRERFEDFKFYLANKPIKIICSYINTYLKENKSDMLMTIEGFKKLKSGEMRQKLNPIIYRGGEEGKEYSVFSGGEKVRLNISADLAFQELINSSSKHGGLNFYCNDELLNSLDGLGIKNAAEAFDNIDKTILLVSHSGADLNYHKIFNIVKKNGVSQIA
jgi:DNA repair exonuclease SbcCD ATPase subunit